MAITRTINYTQNVPVSLGFSNYINTTPSRNVRVSFGFDSTQTDSKMGTVIFSETPNVEILYGRKTSLDTIFGNVTIEGPVADVNTCLNSAQFKNHFYDAENLDQDFLSLNRALPTDRQGELQIQINAGASLSLAVGAECRISTALSNITFDGVFTVMAIDSSNSAIRLWLTYRGDYGVDDKYYSSNYKNVSISTETVPCYLQTYAGTNIAPITDVSYNNPHGQFASTVSIKNATTFATEESGTITYSGSFFIAEPTFSTAPPATFPDNVTLAGYWSTTNLTSTYAQIAQADDNYQSVQYLIKCLENDPKYLGVTAYTALVGYPSGGTADAQLAFIGAAIDNRASKDVPTYITDESYGLFGVNQVNDRISVSYTTGEVRWNFYGLPSECNYAFKNTTYFRPPTNDKDFAVETRIVNGRTRIYSSRGK
jgi:hypothetical protein